MAGVNGTRDAQLVALTYLAPGIPLGFFECVTQHLSKVLGRAIALESEGRSSGPMHGHDDPFGEGRADIGFLCSPSYLYLRAQAEPSVELVPAGFSFCDPRAQGEPVYFSDVVVRDDHGAQDFADLAGGVWGFNDDCSLSGHFATRQKLAESGSDERFFARYVQTGSHHASLAAVVDGSIDGAAIDSTVLTLLRRERSPALERVRVIESWGPFPIQPVVVRAGLGADWARRVADALLDLPRAALETYGLDGCVPIDDDAYAQERAALCALGELSPQNPRARS